MSFMIAGGAIIGGAIGGTGLAVAGGALAGGLLSSAMDGGGSAPGADPLVAQAAQSNVQLGKDQLAFSKQQYADQQAYIAKLQPYIDQYMQSSAKNLALTDQQNQQQFNDFQTLWRPNELAYLKDVNEAGSQAEQDRLAAQAGAGVQTQIDIQRQATARDMASMGVTPDAGRAESTGRVADVLGAAARAGAENAARIGERDRGTAMRAGAVGVGRGNATTALQGVQVRNQTSSSGSSVGTVPFNLGTTAGTQYQSGVSSSGALNTAGGNLALGNGQLGLAGWQANYKASADQSQGLGQLAALGVNTAMKAGMFTSDETLKEDKKPISGRDLVKAVKSMRVERWKYKPGVADEGEHIGTYAQDFAEATGVGDGKAIPIISAIGVLQGALKQTIRDVADVRRIAMAGVRV